MNNRDELTAYNKKNNYDLRDVYECDENGGIIGGPSPDDESYSSNPKELDMMIAHDEHDKKCLIISVITTVWIIGEIIWKIFRTITWYSCLKLGETLGVITELAELFSDWNISVELGTLIFIPLLTSCIWSFIKLSMCWIPYFRRREKPLKQGNFILCAIIMLFTIFCF